MNNSTMRLICFQLGMIIGLLIFIATRLCR